MCIGEGLLSHTSPHPELSPQNNKSHKTNKITDTIQSDTRPRAVLCRSRALALGRDAAFGIVAHLVEDAELLAGVEDGPIKHIQPHITVALRLPWVLVVVVKWWGTQKREISIYKVCL